MRFYEALGVVMTGVVGVAFVIGRTKVNAVLKIRDRVLPHWMTVASPLVVAITVLAGLIFLSAQNLAGTPFAHQRDVWHSTAVHELFFRH